MKKSIIFLLIFMKRLISKKLFLIALLVFPICSLFLRISIDKSPTTINIGICTEDNGEYSSIVISNLTKNYDSTNFILCRSREELITKINNREIECGYVLTKDFSQSVIENKLENAIDIYVLPNELASSLANEYVFSEVYKISAYNRLVNFVTAQKYYKNYDIDNCKRELKQLYDKYVNSSDTFSFTYINSANNKQVSTNYTSDFIISSVRGIASLFILIGAFIGSMYLYKDSSKGIFNSISVKQRHIYRLLDIFSASIIAAISGYISIIVCNLQGNIFKDIIKILVYCFICSLYCYLLWYLIPSDTLFCMIIPIILVASIVLCSVFMDFSSIIPPARYLKWLLPTSYYL